MDLNVLSHSLQRNAPIIVFVNVLLQQLGLPVPSVPTMLLAASLVASPRPLVLLLGLAVLASVMADSLWYAAGRVFGHRVLAGLCKVSINPSTCVHQTEARFTRWGVWSLLVAKFVPAFSTVAPPIAGTLRMPLRQFVAASAAGAALWAGAALTAGWLLRGAVPGLIAALDRRSGSAFVVLLSAAALWLAWRVWRRHQIHQLRAMVHITVDDLLAQLASARPPVMVDLRSRAMIVEAGEIAGAVVTDSAGVLQAMAAWPRHQSIVTLCACPQDAGAVIAAGRLRNAGYREARPLLGGWEAWRAAVPR
ncbi:MAG: VTT domain-containing protein [Caldimonas sp.]